jgi:hypothetical protein
MFCAFLSKNHERDYLIFYEIISLKKNITYEYYTEILIGVF